MKKINKTMQDKLFNGDIAVEFDKSKDSVEDLLSIILKDRQLNSESKYYWFHEEKRILRSAPYIDDDTPHTIHPLSAFFTEERNIVLNVDRWNIQVETREQALQVIGYINSIHKDRFKNYLDDSGIIFIRFDKKDPMNCAYNHWRSEFFPVEESITFEMFEKYIMKKTQNIIGYAAPFDMFDGEIKKGDIGRLKDGSYWVDIYAFPPEWVERDWQPVYEEEKIMIGDKEVTFDGRFCYIDNQSYGDNTIKDLERVFNVMNISSICWHNADVDLEIINKILDKLKK